jgi:PAS domain S-box-containing protein
MTDPQILHALPDAAVLTDPTGVVLFWNDAAAKLWGWTASEMLGRPLMERFPESAREEAHTRLQQIAAGAEWEGESQGYHQDGSRFWIEGQVRPVRDDSGTITAILGLSRPLSPSRAGAIERVRNDGYAKDILNSISAHVAVLGPDGRIQDVNQAWERFAAENSPGGFPPPSTGVGVDYVALCRRASGDHVAEAGPAADGIEEVLQGRRAYFELEYPCDAPTESRWFAMHVTPLNANGGGVVVAHYDITARKQAELAVASQSRRTEMALSAAHMGVWTLDLTTGRIHWSDEVHSIVGITHFDGTMEGWTHLVHPDDLPEMQARFSEDIERRMPFVGEFRIIRPSGEIRWLTNMAQVECAPSGEPLAVVGTVQDVTGKKRSEWALTAYNHILELVAAGNDLRSILEEVVCLVEEQLPGSLCSVLIVDEANGCLRFGAGQSFPEEYNRAVDGVPIGPSSGSCGTAAFRKATVTVTDIATDPLWADYRSVALKHGLKSCVSVPILSSGNVPGREKGSVIGTFALYNRAVGGFDPLTYAVLSGAEHLVRQAVQAGTLDHHGPGGGDGPDHRGGPSGRRGH